jgi:hypothetical protein
MTKSEKIIYKFGVNHRDKDFIDTEGKDFLIVKDFLTKAKLSKAKKYLKDFNSYSMKHHLERRFGKKINLGNGELVFIMDSLGYEWKLEDRNSWNVFFKISLQEWKALVGRARNGEWGVPPLTSKM